MALYTVDLKVYRKIFWPAALTNFAAALISFVVVSTGHSLNLVFFGGDKLVFPVLIAMVLLAFAQASIIKRQLDNLVKYEEFDEKLSHYERIYKLRLFRSF